MVNEEKTIELERERERESIGKKMIELMKIREKRKAKEKQVKTNRKTVWNLSIGMIGAVGIELLFFKWLFGDFFEEYPTANKWLNGFFIAIIVICLLGIIMCAIYHPKYQEELKQLKKQEKNLEKQLENE